MNTVIFMGRLTADPDIRSTRDGKPVGAFSIAVDRRFRRDGDPEADFFRCTAFGKLAEFVEKYLKKGTKIVLRGTIQNNNYTDRQGVKRYDTQVIADSIEFAESKKSEEPARKEPEPDKDGFVYCENGLDEELPFN